MQLSFSWYEGYTGTGQDCQPATAVSCNERPEMCHANAECIYSHEKNEYVCVCKHGSVGDGYRNCIVQGLLGFHLMRLHDTNYNLQQLISWFWFCK